jgi:PEGA domain
MNRDTLRDNRRSAAELVTGIYDAYDRLKARQGGLSAVSIGQLGKESGVPIERLQQFLLSEARQDRVDLHPTTLLWDHLSAADKAGATPVSGRSEPAITVTIREKLATAVFDMTKLAAAQTSTAKRLVDERKRDLDFNTHNQTKNVPTGPKIGR